MKDITVALARSDGPAALDAQYAAIVKAHYAESGNRREPLFLAFSDFDSDEGQSVAKAWLERAPASPFARAAAGHALLAAARKARGAQWMEKTPAAQIDAMTRLLSQARPLLEAALAAEPQLSPACADLMDLAQLGGDATLATVSTAKCLEVDPASWNVNAVWLSSLEPRWGGSVEAMNDAVATMRKRLAENAGLGRLLARPVGITAYESTLGHEDTKGVMRDAWVDLKAASLLAPDPSFLGRAGMAAARAGDLRHGLGYLSQALRFSPDSPMFLIERAALLEKLGDHAAALAEAQRAGTVDDSRCGCRDDRALGELLIDLGMRDDARIALARAMQSPSDRANAFEELCQTYIDVDEETFDRRNLLDCTSRLVAEFPTRPFALHARAWVLYRIGDRAADAVAQRFRAAMDPTDDTQEAMSDELKQLSDEMRGSHQHARPKR